MFTSIEKLLNLGVPVAMLIVIVWLVIKYAPAAIKALQDKNSRMAEQWTEDMRNVARDAVIRERERRDFSDSIIKSEIDRLVRARSLEEAAAFVEKHQIADAPSGQVLDPRMDGNRAGIAYADGIRSLISEDNKK